ncbi:Uncharacterized protein YigE, DUF2233 family [Devosia crocina]|uniref:Uncharacterized protein YigE, DUF2233 family n=1 Tax=Devosia crocina TaxID=429728 RepID=A0A1I7NR66_9HYPH|nr:phosphodiester glycosidase family protein [Devosia crocina]SFV37159.1 Uncharacterized protein YigE, DUF2233 family [Devosia crocina]
MTMTRIFLRAAALLLSLVALVTLAQPGAASPCEHQDFDRLGFVVCSVDPAQADLRLFWQNPEGDAYRSFSAVSDQLERSGERLVFAMNAGMYQSDFSPMGLYVESGEELRSPNLRDLSGSPSGVPNFYKKPNGVFLLTDQGAQILPTETYLERRPPVRFATQSGPMLVIDGTLHPAFIEGSTDRRPRSGVGVCENGLIRFAISDRAVNFHDFARLFRDHLGCANALFLDGGRGTGLYDPEQGRNDFSWHGGFGPMFGLVERPG